MAARKGDPNKNLTEDPSGYENRNNYKWYIMYSLFCALTHISFHDSLVDAVVISVTKEGVRFSTRAWRCYNLRNEATSYSDLCTEVLERVRQGHPTFEPSDRQHVC